MSPFSTRKTPTSQPPQTVASRFWPREVPCGGRGLLWFGRGYSWHLATADVEEVGWWGKGELKGWRFMFDPPRKLIWEWKIHYEWRCMDLIENRDFPNIMLVFRGVVVLVCWFVGGMPWVEGSPFKTRRFKGRCWRTNQSVSAKWTQPAFRSGTLAHVCSRVLHVNTRHSGMVKSPYPRLSHLQL